MLWVRRVLDVQEKRGTALAVIEKNHLALRADGTLSPESYCELIAQGFGVCEACRRLQKGLTLDGGGYLVSIRDMQVFDSVQVGQELRICTQKMDECFDTYIVQGTVYQQEKCVAQATIYIFMWQGKQPPKTV